MNQDSRIPPSFAPTPAVADLVSWPARWICLLIFASTLAAYWPALNGTFIWDDSGHVTRADLRPLAGLGRIWFEIGATQQYYPLTHSAFWLEHQLWGDAPLGYHLLNVLLHATAACLFGVILRQLAVPGAWLAALMFALHPVCVESVAWISEQKNTLSTVFYLGAALAYLRFAANRRPAQYALATALFVLALLTKTVTATLPAALMVVFWWQRGRLEWRRDVAPLLPWFGIGVAAGLFTTWVEHTFVIRTRAAAFSLGAVERGLIAGRVVWFYLGKLLWPANLAFIYPRWPISATAAWQYLFPLAAIAALGALWWWRRHRRGPLAAALFFGGTLFPVLGFLNIFPFLYSFVADHFQYLACLGIFTAVGAGLADMGARTSLRTVRVAAAALLLAFGMLTWRQSGIYRDVFTLYETTIARNPACWMAHNNLGIALARAGRTEEAIAHFKQSLQIHPGNAEAENNLGDELTKLGRPGEALPHLQRALQLQPNLDQGYVNLGLALMALGRPNEGLAAFTTASRQNPRDPKAHYNLGVALALQGRVGEAISHFERAVQLKPDYAEAELNWGLGLTLANRFPEAVPHFERSLQLKSDSAAAFHTYGRALADHGRYEDAIVQYRKALQIDPNFAPAHLDLAVVLQRVGRPEEAQRHYLESQRLGQPGY
jgi:tetratricopeptide (TPR) repeat protein